MVKKLSRKQKKTKKKKLLTGDFLRKLGVPEALIGGLLVASVLGWGGYKTLNKIKDYYQLKKVFLTQSKIVEVVDGDTVILENGLKLRLLGIDAPPGRTDKGKSATEYLKGLVLDKEVLIEYGSYQNDQYGRLLGYLFLDCTTQKYCQHGKRLVNEIMVKEDLAELMIQKGHKKLKYYERLVNKDD